LGDVGEIHALLSRNVLDETPPVGPVLLPDTNYEQVFVAIFHAASI
jgi:hypothetical protein